MRCFFEKARTLQGWPGFLLDPHLDQSYDVVTGILQSRKILREIIEMDLPVASEFLHPQLTQYFQEGVSWGVIGARTSTSPIHRQLASSFSFPCSVKNTLCGDLNLSIQAIQVAQSKNLFVETTLDGSFRARPTPGNLAAHLVLRGSLLKPNYDLSSILQAEAKMLSYGIDPRIIIDCAHGNSDKNPDLQKEILLKQLHSVLPNSVRGFMLESYLEKGCQECTPFASPNISVTDPCLSWDETEEILASL